MRYEDENIWLTQKMMATLYDVDVCTINEHIKKIYSDSELEEDSTIRNFRIVQTEGSRQVTRDTKHYSLQMIIAVGFKVNSERAVQFRKWVNQIAKDYTIKGWVMDDERLKRGTYLTEKYFDEQLERMLNCSHRLRWPLYMLEDRLTEHLNTVDDEAQERMDILVRQMMERQGITEELKARDQMEWVRAVNNIRNVAEEIVLRELVYI